MTLAEVFLKKVVMSKVVSAPKVSIGLPVYNGERFLQAAIESLLGQKYTDFELIISDNGSTDLTESICRRYAENDTRVRYTRSESNHGASWNYNRVFELASGRYFKWAAHDDICRADFLGKCVEVLDLDSSVVLCMTRAADVDEYGALMRSTSMRGRGMDARAHVRFRDLVAMAYQCEEVFGLIRRDVLGRTGLIGPYSDSDRVLLAELGLHGRFQEVADELFLHRVHSSSSVEQFPGRHHRTLWFDQSASLRIVFPYWRQLKEYLIAIRRTHVPLREQLHCFLTMLFWLLNNRGQLVSDIAYNAKNFLLKHFPWSRTLWRYLRRV
ncbi:MAG: glycosyltransferase family 2 protein [Candidatus Dechloromonas phosphoritropha]